MMKIVNSIPTASIKKTLQPFQKEKSFFDFVLLLAFLLKKPKEWILAHPEKTLSSAQKKKLEALVKRRQAGEPLAYILKEKEFFSLPFAVSPAVLIPRPETELVVEKGIEIITKTPAKKIILDIGTGSGCVIISLAKTLIEEKNLTFFGLDLSLSALLVAKKNARNILKKEAGKIKFLPSDLLQIKNRPTFWQRNICDSGTEILILANLPYISKKEYSTLDKSVKNFEPQLALLSGADGLDHYRKLFKQVKKLKKDFPQNNFTLLLEFGWDQKPLLEKLIKTNFPTAKTTFFKDLAGRWRVSSFTICKTRNMKPAQR